MNTYSKKQISLHVRLGPEESQRILDWQSTKQVRNAELIRMTEALDIRPEKPYGVQT
jgi:hypothetical protein